METCFNIAVTIAGITLESASDNRRHLNNLRIRLDIGNK